MIAFLFYKLQGGGGDMSLLTKFDEGAVRTGFILDQVCKGEIRANNLINLHRIYSHKRVEFTHIT